MGRIDKFALAVLGAFALAGPLAAQDLRDQEVIVTGSRIDSSDYSDEMPAVGLRQTADFLIQGVTIRGDTRDPEQREQEIRAMLRQAVALGDGNGVELAFGSYLVTRLTAANSVDLELQNDRRPDSQRIDFLLKAPLAGSNIAEAQARIRRFMERVPETGRAQMDQMGDATLSVVGPDRYRDRIIALIAADAKAQADILGPDYGVELTGLNMPVQWSRAGPGEVLLYIPYELKIMPRP